MVKNRINKILDDFKVYLTKKWLFICNLILKIYFSSKRTLMFILLMIILLEIALLLYFNYEEITAYLLLRNTDSQANITGFFPTLFTTIGASILGVIAITFSLSLFAVQQAADKHTPTVLISFLKNRTNNYIFWSIAFISLIFFAFAILPLNKFIFFEVISTFVLILGIFLLLKKQYAHITRIVNPIHQIIFYHNEAIRGLNKIDKWMDLMIKIKAIRPGPENNGNEGNENQQKT